MYIANKSRVSSPPILSIYMSLKFLVQRLF
nr:MAG TPA: hypothetical protein [Caudoviricetes sp.]